MEIIRHTSIVLRQNKEVPLTNFEDADWRARMGRVVLVTGTYDLITPHHLTFIRQCATLEPALTCVLALDSDEYVKRRKGSLRPIVPYEARRDILSELQHISWIVPHEGCNEELIRIVRPDIFTMSYATTQERPEDRKSDIQAVSAVGGRVVALPVEDGYVLQSGDRISTTRIIETIVQRHRAEAFYESP